MHDMEAVRLALRHLEGKNPKKVKISLGKMRGEKEAFIELFREMTKGTPFEKTELEVTEIAVEIKCKCGFEGRLEIPSHIHFARCPKCGAIAEITKGNELIVELEGHSTE